MQLCEFLGFHTGINNLSFLLLLESTLVDNWLHTFQETVRVSFSQGQNMEDDSAR